MEVLQSTLLAAPIDECTGAQRARSAVRAPPVAFTISPRPLLFAASPTGFSRLRSAGPCSSCHPTQFLPVPDGVVGAAGSLSPITDTVLGSLHLAICEPTTGRTLGLLFDVFDGTVKCTTKQGQQASTRTPCAAALAAAGVSLTEEHAACDLGTLACGYLPLELNHTHVLRADPALVSLDVTRFNVSAGDARLSLMRDVIHKPEPLTGLDCAAPLDAWPRVLRACEAFRAAHEALPPLQ